MNLTPTENRTAPDGRTIRPLCLLAVLLVSIVILWSLPATAYAAPAADEQVHVVRAGETLGQIAALYDTTVEALIAANDLANPNLIVTGQAIIIPDTEPIEPEPEIPVSGAIPATHTVSAGETLSSIARRYGITAEELARWNEIEDIDHIEIGHELRLYLDAGDAGDILPVGIIEGVAITPSPVMQGQTVSIVITTSQTATITATFDGRTIPFVSEGHRHWALLGVHSVTSPGFYPIQVSATGNSTSGTGDATSRMTVGIYVLAGDFETYDVVIPPEKNDLLDPALVQEETALVSRVFGAYDQTPLWEGLFSNPMEARFRRITSAFGERRSYNGGPVSSTHAGLDYGAPEGTPVYAPARGEVMVARTLSVRGNAIIISHGCGVYSGYWHLSELNVEVGDEVQAGDLIGKVGTTGLSTGAHLHWEMRVGSMPVDPLQWVEQDFPTGLSASPAATPTPEYETALDALPLAIGNSWAYSVTLDYAEGGETLSWSGLVTETVVAGSSRDDAQVFLIEETGNHPLHSQADARKYRYVVLDDRVYQLPSTQLTTPLIQADGKGYEDALRFLWPMPEGEQWRLIESDDEPSHAWEVIERKMVRTPEANYSDSYESTYSTGSEYSKNWLCPGIGIVQKAYHLDETMDELWQLVVYHIEE